MIWLHKLPLVNYIYDDGTEVTLVVFRINEDFILAREFDDELDCKLKPYNTYCFEPECGAFDEKFYQLIRAKHTPSEEDIKYYIQKMPVHNELHVSKNKLWQLIKDKPINVEVSKNPYHKEWWLTLEMEIGLEIDAYKKAIKILEQEK